MSLTTRVAQANAALGAEASLQNEETMRLKAQVLERLSADDLAIMMERNPERARNEIRSACRTAFSGSEWASSSPEQRRKLVESVIDSVFGFGPLEDMLADPRITEIMVNGTRSIYYERDGVLHPAPAVFGSEDEIRTLIDRILGPLGRRVDESSPLVNARLPQGHRVNAVISPISTIGPVVTIRKFSEHVITLEEMMALGSIDEAVRTFLIWAVRMRKNIAVSGGTGSGKTTLLNALSCEIPHSERIITIEDSAELRFHEHPHVVGLEARPRNAEGTGEVTIRDLVMNALRMRPDRIVVGECRGAEALDMLQAMNTGHDGSLTTLHANSPEDVVSRLTTMVRYQADLPVDVVEAYIASALDIVVQTARGVDGGRYVSEIVEFSYELGSRKVGMKTLCERKLGDTAVRWLEAPSWLGDIEMKGVASEKEVAAWKQMLFSS